MDGLTSRDLGKGYHLDRNRLADLQDLIDHGESPERAMARLGVTQGMLDQRERRATHPDITS